MRRMTESIFPASAPVICQGFPSHRSTPRPTKRKPERGTTSTGPAVQSPSRFWVITTGEKFLRLEICRWIWSISGRRKNTIITTQGRNIAPEWVESILLSQPEIAQAFVYGEGLAFPQALIVPSVEGADIAMAVERANASLPTYAQLAWFDMVPPFIPQNGMLTPTGRLRREQIAQTYHDIIKGVQNHGVLRNLG